MGLASRSPFIRGTLDKLEIVPEFEGIGDFKTARFMFTEKDHTPASREMVTWLLESLSSQMAADIAASRGMEPADLRALIAKGPYSGEEAQNAKLVDTIQDWHGFQDTVRTQDGSRAVRDLAQTLPEGGAGLRRRRDDRRGARGGRNPAR